LEDDNHENFEEFNIIVGQFNVKKPPSKEVS